MQQGKVMRYVAVFAHISNSWLFSLLFVGGFLGGTGGGGIRGGNTDSKVTEPIKKVPMQMNK